MSQSSSVDTSLLELFRAELDTHLPALSEGLLTLEKQPEQTAPLAALMRAAHSIKGAAKIVGVAQAVRVAHALEDCFVAAQEGRIALSSDAVDALLRGVDALQRITVGNDALADEEMAKLLAVLDAVRSGAAPKPQPVSAPLAPVGPVTLRPAGDLDAAGAEELRPRLAALLREGAAEIRFDFAAVRDVDTSGLALLAAAADKAEASGKTVLHIINATSEVRRLLENTRLDRVYRIAGEGR